MVPKDDKDTGPSAETEGKEGRGGERGHSQKLSEEYTCSVLRKVHCVP